MKKYTDEWLDYNDISEDFIDDRTKALELTIHNAKQQGNRYLIIIIDNNILFEALLPILLNYNFKAKHITFG